MQRQLQITADGSHTIQLQDQQITYHSIHGALQESKHVFIDAGWQHYLQNSSKQAIHILEMGFGTGLNALLTLEAAGDVSVYYEALELHPLQPNEYAGLNFNLPFLQDIHACAWEESIKITPTFQLKKVQVSLLEYQPLQMFDIVYFDAFAPTAQPELWTEQVFAKLFSYLNSKGILVTYCSKGYVRRNMLAAGFQVEKIPGPPFKREMLRATKKG
jgi:tRNA U34 5-methylaminomethyl-2-thiouridine-forming methyltransferase MnmC